MWNPFSRAADINSKQVMTRMSEGWTPYIVDVRSIEEIRITGVIDGTVKCQPHTTIRKAVKTLPKDGDILFVCRSGARSSMAIHTLASSGVDKSRLYNLKGGVIGWKKSGGKFINP